MICQPNGFTARALALGAMMILLSADSWSAEVPITMVQAPASDDTVMLIYDASRGSLSIDFGTLPCRMIEIGSRKGLWQGDRPAFVGESTFDIWSPHKVFVVREKPFSILEFGDVLPKDLTFQTIQEELRVKGDKVKHVQLLILNANHSSDAGDPSTIGALAGRKRQRWKPLMSPIRTSITRHANGSVTSSRITYSVDNYGVSELGNIRLAIEGKPFTGNSSSGPILLSGTVDGEAQGASGAGNRRFTYQTIDGGSACTFADISFEIVNGKLSVLGQSFSVDASPTLIVIDDEGSIDGVVDLSEVNVAGNQIGNSTPANQPPVFSVTTDRRERIRQMHQRSLRSQYRRGGLRAVLERTDNPIVNDLDLDNPEEVKAQLDRAESDATAAIGKLNRELSALADAYRTKAEEALQQEMNAVFENLGDDGARLRALVSRMSTERPQLVPNDKPKLIKDGFVSAVMNSLENNGLDLSEKQRDLIQSQYAPYAQWRRDFVNDSLGVRGPGPDPEIFGVPEKDLSSEAVALLLDEERALEQRMRDLLISPQIEKAESMVLNERYRLEGLHAVLDCTEYRAIKDLQFEASIEDIKLSVQCAVASSLWQCEELLIELLQFDHGFAERVDEIKRREAEAVLDQLGADGKKLRALIAEWN